MIKFATTTKDGLPLVTLGITDENVRRMRAGMPVHVSAGAMVAMGLPPVHVVVMLGADEKALVAELRNAGIELPDGVDEAVASVSERPR